MPRPCAGRWIPGGRTAGGLARRQPRGSALLTSLPTAFCLMLLPTSETILEPQTPEKQQRPNHPLPRGLESPSKIVVHPEETQGSWPSRAALFPSFPPAKPKIWLGDPLKPSLGEEAGVTPNLLVVMNTYWIWFINPPGDSLFHHHSLLGDNSFSFDPFYRERNWVTAKKKVAELYLEASLGRTPGLNQSPTDALASSSPHPEAFLSLAAP